MAFVSGDKHMTHKLINLKSHLIDLIKLLLLKPTITITVYLELNILCIYKLYFRHILLSYYKFKHNLARVNHSYHIRNKENINICLFKH